MIHINAENKKALVSISNNTLREYVATGALVFSIMSFYFIGINEILKIHELTYLIFFGMFYGFAAFIFKADMNPALTLARWVRGNIKWFDFILRVSVQFGAAISAFLILRIMGNEFDKVEFFIKQVNPETISAIDIIMIEGFMVGLLTLVVFGRSKQAYKPALTALVYVIAMYYSIEIYSSYLNILFIVSNAVLTNTWTWHIIYFTLAHLMGVFIMVIFWIKDTWSEY